MYQYSVSQWFLFFYLYCFLGWCVESTYVSIKDFHPVNRGFLKGPFLPLYGSGAIVMLVVSMPFRDNLVYTYLAGCAGATILEYITGVMMEKLFKVRYWDYSRLKFNFQGQICLGTTLSWGLLTVLLTRFLHRPVEKYVLTLTVNQVRVIVAVLTVIVGIDFVISFRAAIDLKNILIKMDAAKKELLSIQRRLTEMLDYAAHVTNGIAEGITSHTFGIAESFTGKKDEISQNISLRFEEMKQSLEDKFSRFGDFLKNRQGVDENGMEEEFLELKAQYQKNLQPPKGRNPIKDAILKRMIRSNPDMTSGIFRDSLEELKAKLGYRKPDQKNTDRSLTEENAPAGGGNDSE